LASQYVLLLKQDEILTLLFGNIIFDMMHNYKMRFWPLLFYTIITNQYYSICISTKKINLTFDRVLVIFVINQLW